MTSGPEIEKPQGQPQEGVIKEIPETPEIPTNLQEQGVVARPTQVTAQVADAAGKPLIQTPATQTVTITIPTSQQQLADWSKGSPTNSLTWFAFFWLRMIKKALHFGWRIITKGGQINASAV
jgi:hypothetical protein